MSGKKALSLYASVCAPGHEILPARVELAELDGERSTTDA